MHTSNLWHVQTRAVAPTFQIKEPTQKQNTTSKPDKNLLSLYFSCVFFFFKEVFGIIHNRSQALRENRLNASPLISFPIFFCSFDACQSSASRPERGLEGGCRVLPRGAMGPRCPRRLRLGPGGAPGSIAPLTHPTSPAGKRSPKAAPAPLPNLVVPLNVTL